MTRFAVTPVLIGFLAFAPGAFAQAAKATPATAANAPATAVAKARMAPPVKGTAYVEVIQGQGKTVGSDIVTVSKIKNVSNAPIAGLRVDEYWYNAKNETVSGAQTFRVLKPMMPGDIVEVVLKSPKTPDMQRVNRIFGHANGTVKPTKVAAFKKDS